MEMALNGFWELSFEQSVGVNGGGVSGVIKVAIGGAILVGCGVGAYLSGGTVLSSSNWWLAAGGGAALIVDGIDGH